MIHEPFKRYNTSLHRNGIRNKKIPVQKKKKGFWKPKFMESLPDGNPREKQKSLALPLNILVLCLVNSATNSKW